VKHYVVGLGLCLACGDEPPAWTTSAAGVGAALSSSASLVTVSFTFDDTYGPQVEAAAILEAHGLRGTFYVNSPQLHRATARPESNSSMSITEVLEMQARGHDIGGHTLGHLSLTDIPEAERIREIQGDRAQLLALGIEARSFAYPYGHVEDDDSSLGRPVLELARESGFSSARDTNGFELEDCSTGPEGLPPADPFILRSTRSVNEPPGGEARLIPADTADSLLEWVDRAAACGGGWLPLVFHHMHADCSDADAPAAYCFGFEELDRLAAALGPGTRCPDGSQRCYGVRVETVSGVIGDLDLAPAPEVPGLRNASLERALGSGETECIRRTGASGAVFSRSELANTGAASERLEVAGPFDGVAEIGVQRDFGECAIFASEGRSYDLSLHYRADPEGDPPTLRFATYRLSSDYLWLRWESGVDFTARSPGEWVRRSFTTSPVPSDTIAISFGLRQESAGAINVDDFDSVPLE
jgi:peptidoglycan/xylan/chitin deacetylase (PgdA/CDA1 family)